MTQKKEIMNAFLRPFPGFQFYFWSMIVMIILNLISPSDGRGDTLFTILVNKMLNRPRMTHPTGPWSYSIYDFSYVYYNHTLQFKVNSTENVVAKCIVADIETFEDQDALIEKTMNVFFLHENREEHLSINHKIRLDNEYQLICKLYAVTRTENEEKYYRSDLMTLTDESVSFSAPRINEEESTVTFLVYNNLRKSLHIIPDTQDYSPRHNYLYHLLLCKFSDKDHPPSREELIKQEAGIIHVKDVLPITYQFIIPIDQTRDKLWCILRRRDESREIYKDIVEQPYLVNP